MKKKVNFQIKFDALKLLLMAVSHLVANGK